jgi:hypothetical protein
LAPNVHAVSGDYDDETMGFPETRVIQVGQFRIGIIHGHQILPYGSPDAEARTRRKLNADILIRGHSHKNEVELHDGCYHINPVSKKLFFFKSTRGRRYFSKYFSFVCGIGFYHRSLFSAYRKCRSIFHFVVSAGRQTCLLCL